MEMNEEHLKQLTRFKRPIPGSSLTNDPDSPWPWEKAPEFTIQRVAMEYLYTTLIEPEVYMPVLQSVRSGIPVVDIAQSILFKGFSEGKWNPDLMMLLIEPTMYILASIAEQCGIDYLLYEGDTFESYEEDEEENDKKSLEDIKNINSQMSQHLKFKDLRPSQITKQSVPEEALEVVENFEPPQELVSLLERRKEEKNNSLLERT